jgi:dihydroorotate dehydrogenase electron transfer subunit
MIEERVNTVRPDGPGLFETAIAANIRLSGRYFLLNLVRPPGFPDPRPGSFVHLGVPARDRFFLRRPLSIFDCDEETIGLLVVEKGEGTKILRRLEPGARLDFIGPLGTGFPELPGRRLLAVTGGVGLAPLYFYRRIHRRTLVWNGGPASNRLVYGGRTEDDLFRGRIDLDGRDVLLATEDGSYGFKGNAAELARLEIERAAPDVLFSCGPTPMLRAVAELASARGIPHWVSLENRMGCAVGACRGCVVPVRPEGGAEAKAELSPIYKTVCKNGPVFPAEEIDWDRLPEP